LIQELSDKVRQTPFQDARNTSLDPALLGPPTVEYAPFSRIPGGKVRKDGRQGTIDQDPEFIAFLESLTNPPPKPVPVDEAAEPEKEERITITPLIQFLRDKKANKAKEASPQSKTTKKARMDAKEQRSPEKVQAKRLLSRSERLASGDKQTKVDRATKDAVKAATKQMPSRGPDKTAAAGPATKDTTAPPSSPAAERKRERGSLSAATKILRRDLGLGPPATSRRRATEKPASTSTPSESPSNPTQAKPDTPSAADSQKAPTTPKAGRPDGPAQKPTPTRSPRKEPPTEPAAARNATPLSKTTQAPAGTPAKSGSQPAGPRKTEPVLSTSTQAFLKHANPSQGVTEDLLEKGFSQFGQVVKVEIDRKKGFGYVDFEQPEALQNAIRASPVQIAQSQVVVLERRTGNAPAQSRGNHRAPPSVPPASPMTSAPSPRTGQGPPSGPRGARGGRGGGRPKGAFGGRGGGRGGAKPATSEGT
jgi:regulator of nonsense transcripts 3